MLTTDFPAFFFLNPNHDHLMAYCDRCDRWFQSIPALVKHEGVSDAHWPCEDCDLDYVTHYGLREHYIQSPKHRYCRECDFLFDLEESRIQHMEAHHWYCQKHDEVRNSTVTAAIYYMGI